MSRRTIHFTKYEGLGNDFVVVDLRTGDETPSPLDPDIARSICDRHFGVGGDGVLGILPPRSESADARMIVINADGSEAEMCGNGIRCIAKQLYDEGPEKREIGIDTEAGLLSCTVTPGEDGSAELVAVEMGRPEMARARIPMTGPEGAVTEEQIQLGDRTFPITCVSMGNPHAITFTSTEPVRELAAFYGPLLEQHPSFPQRTNAEFARVSDGGSEIELCVWERGCGITLACGTGACATAVAAAVTGRTEHGREIAVHLPGGTLFCTVAPDLSGVTMRGPARRVFAGRIQIFG